MKIRAVTYSRVSSDDHGKDGLNLAGQIELCRKHALSRNYTIVAELSEDDRGVSGAAMDSPALHEALLMASQKQFDVLVVREIDRFARSLAKQLIIEQEFKKYNVALEFVLESYAETPEGCLHKNIKAVIAEYERVKIIERVTRGRQQKVRGGNILVYGRPPYGYRFKQNGQKGELEILESEARIVRLIYQWYLHGDDTHGPLASSAIADSLCKWGVPTPSLLKRKNNRWSRNTVQGILTNKTYAGVWHYGKFTSQNGKRSRNPFHKWLPVSVPAILPLYVWSAAQERRKKNRQTNPRNTRRSYLLGQRATCAVCGDRLFTRASGRAGKLRQYYFCPSMTQNKVHQQSVFYRSELVDKAVWSWLRNYLANPDAVEAGFLDFVAHYNSESSPMLERIAIVDSLLSENREQLQKILDLYIDGNFSRESLTKRKIKLEGKIYELSSELSILKERIEFWTNKSVKIESIKDSISEINTILGEADKDFSRQRQIIEKLDIHAVIARQQDGIQIKINFELGEVVFTVQEGHLTMIQGEKTC